MDTEVDEGARNMLDQQLYVSEKLADLERLRREVRVQPQPSARAERQQKNAEDFRPYVREALPERAARVRMLLRWVR
jgi:hypothetical protein